MKHLSPAIMVALALAAPEVAAADPVPSIVLGPQNNPSQALPVRSSFVLTKELPADVRRAVPIFVRYAYRMWSLNPPKLRRKYTTSTALRPNDCDEVARALAPGRFIPANLAALPRGRVDVPVLWSEPPMPGAPETKLGQEQLLEHKIYHYLDGAHSVYIPPVWERTTESPSFHVQIEDKTFFRHGAQYCMFFMVEKDTVKDRKESLLAALRERIVHHAFPAATKCGEEPPEVEPVGLTENQVDYEVNYALYGALKDLDSPAQRKAVCPGGNDCTDLKQTPMDPTVLKKLVEAIWSANPYRKEKLEKLKEALEATLKGQSIAIASNIRRLNRHLRAAMPIRPAAVVPAPTPAVTTSEVGSAPTVGAPAPVAVPAAVTTPAVPSPAPNKCPPPVPPPASATPTTFPTPHVASTAVAGLGCHAKPRTTSTPPTASEVASELLCLLFAQRKIQVQFVAPPKAKMGAPPGPYSETYLWNNHKILEIGLRDDQIVINDGAPEHDIKTADLLLADGETRLLDLLQLHSVLRVGAGQLTKEMSFLDDFLDQNKLGKAIVVDTARLVALIASLRRVEAACARYPALGFGPCAGWIEVVKVHPAASAEPRVTALITMATQLQSHLTQWDSAIKEVDVAFTETRLDVGDRATPIDSVLELSQQSYVSSFVTPTIGVAILPIADQAFAIPYASAQIFFWPNHVDEPMWSNGRLDLRRLVALEVGLGITAASFGPDNRYSQLTTYNTPPFFYGAAFQLIPYTTVSVGGALMKVRRSTFAREELALFNTFYVGISVELNFFNLARGRFSKAEYGSAQSFVRPGAASK